MGDKKQMDDIKKVVVDINGRTYKDEVNSARETAALGYDYNAARTWLAEQTKKAYEKYQKQAQEKNRDSRKPKNLEYVIE